jgi:hypothetical protein
MERRLSVTVHSTPETDQDAEHRGGRQWDTHPAKSPARLRFHIRPVEMTFCNEPTGLGLEMVPSHLWVSFSSFYSDHRDVNRPRKSGKH